MGAEAITIARIGRRTSEGKALLESDHLLFRGDFRLKIPFAELTAVAENDGVLSLTYAEGTAAFTLGPRAKQWADKIRNPKTLIEKLGVKPEHHVVVLGLRDDAFRAQLVARTPYVSTRRRKDADVIFFGAAALRDLDALAPLRDYIKRGGMIWAITPKGKNGLKDTDVLNAGRAAGLVDVKAVAFSPTHTATKFVIPRADR
jgi:hypothetical protein